MNTGFINGDLYLQSIAAEGNGGSIAPRCIFCFFVCVFLPFGKEHEQKQQNQYNAKYRKHRCVDDLLHMQYDNFCSGTHKRPPVCDMICSAFYNVCEKQEDYSFLLRDKRRTIL